MDYKAAHSQIRRARSANDGASLVEYLVIALVIASLVIPSIKFLFDGAKDTAEYCMLPKGTVGTGVGIQQGLARAPSVPVHEPQCWFGAERVMVEATARPVPTPEPVD